MSRRAFVTHIVEQTLAVVRRLLSTVKVASLHFERQRRALGMLFLNDGHVSMFGFSRLLSLSCKLLACGRDEVARNWEMTLHLSVCFRPVSDQIASHQLMEYLERLRGPRSFLVCVCLLFSCAI